MQSTDDTDGILDKRAMLELCQQRKVQLVTARGVEQRQRALHCRSVGRQGFLLQSLCHTRD